MFRYTYGGIRIINMQVSTEHKTRSAHNTGRKTGREESIHTRHRIIETGKQTRNGLGGYRGYICFFHSHSGVETLLPEYDAYIVRLELCDDPFESNISGKQFNQVR